MVAGVTSSISLPATSAVFSPAEVATQDSGLQQTVANGDPPQLLAPPPAPVHPSRPVGQVLRLPSLQMLNRGTRTETPAFRALQLGLAVALGPKVAGIEILCKYQIQVNRVVLGMPIVEEAVRAQSKRQIKASEIVYHKVAVNQVVT